MRRCPNLVNADALIATGNQMQAGLPDGRWVAARPYGFHSWRYRWRNAWLVFTGKADALLWTGQ